MVVRRLILAISIVTAAAVALTPLRFERYQVATGSMAPTLRGTHRECGCPRCGHRFAVDALSADLFKAFCPNCGGNASISERESAGDVVAVDRSAYLLKPPSRWDIAAFRRGGETLVKRVVGLPHETVEIRDGDLWINGSRQRKTFDQVMATRQEIFDDAFAPPLGWGKRWERTEGGTFEEGRPLLDGTKGPQTWTYVNFLLDEQQCRPFTDEYAYEGALRADAEPVHDFVVDAEVTRLDGAGALELSLTDGADAVEAIILLAGDRLTMKAGSRATTAKMEPWSIGEQRRVTLALIDRRGHLAIDGVPALEAIDLPDPKSREAVVRPVQLSITGGRVRVDRFRLAHDVHYRPQGMAGQAVRLGGGEYFVLGDHSSVAEDSRSWPHPGVRRQDLIGRVRLPRE